MTAGALRELAFLSDPRLSADGRRAVCVRTVVVQDGDAPPGYRAEIVEVDLDAADDGATAEGASGEGDAARARLVAGGEHGADHPRFSPCGRWLAFLAPSGRDAPTRLRVLDLARGGEARTVAEPPGGVDAFAWRPDGSGLAVVGRDRAPEADPSKVVARTVDRLLAKKDGLPAPGLRPDGVPVLWYAPLDDAAPHRLAAPGDGVQDLAWAPDGRTLWLLGAADAEEGDAWRAGVWRLGLDARGRTRGRLTRVGPSVLSPSSLAVSDDGATVAFLAPSDGTTLAAPTALWTLPAGGGEPVRATDPDLDVGPAVGGDARHGRYGNRPVATGDGWLVNLNLRGASAPAVVRPDGATVAWADAERDGRRVTTTFAHAAGRTLMSVETPRTPGALVLREADGRERTVYDPNAAFVARHDLVDADGPFTTDGGACWWRLTPREARADRAVVVQVHGGPHTNAGFGFSFEHQLLAARGYTVVFANPRGSSSYGAAHATAILGGYGTIDADDVLAVVDHALSDHVAQDAPVHLTGGSYGGFMTNWLAGRTDRFRSAVTQRSICNWTSFYGTSDIGYRFAEQEVRGTPWADLGALWDQSPLKHVAHVTTPILILHADADHRCPVEQAEQWFVALRRIGRAETRLVRFPGEGHELSRSGRPDRRIRRLDEIVGWFESHA